MALIRRVGPALRPLKLAAEPGKAIWEAPVRLAASALRMENVVSVVGSERTVIATDCAEPLVQCGHNRP